MNHKIIPTTLLKINDVPLPDADFQEIEDFSLTFAPREENPAYLSVDSLNQANGQSDLKELRYHLYIQQRRWNHFASHPDKVTETRLREIVNLIRQKLTTNLD